MIDPQRVTHALVDGVRFPQAVEHLARRKGVAEIESLYQLTPYKQLAEHGPILVGLDGPALVGDTLATSDGPLIRGVSWLACAVDTETLGDHLRQFVEITTGVGTQRLFRFADPLVTRHWLASYRDGVPPDVLGPITTWWVPHWSPNWRPVPTLTWEAFLALPKDADMSELSEGEASIPPSHFAPEQLGALQAVRRWQFKEALTEHLRGQATWHRLAPDARGEWLDARLAEARAWGVRSQRHAALWVELALAWGDDFISRERGPYAQWHSQHEAPASLGREQRLEALEAWQQAYVPEVDSPPMRDAEMPTLTQETLQGN